MSALFDFSSLLTVLLLLICTVTYLRELRPTIFDGSVLNSTTNNSTKTSEQQIQQQSNDAVS